jgi:hypothetical protein
MLRVALFIAILLIIIVAVYFPKFRRTLGVMLVLVLGAIGVIIWQDTQEQELEFERVSVNQVQLSQMQSRPGLNARSFVFSGRIQNLAEDYTILSFMLQATLKDCNDGGACDIVGQERTMIPLAIPAGQSRDFLVTIPFPVVPVVKGDAAWEYHIKNIRAR